MGTLLATKLMRFRGETYMFGLGVILKKVILSELSVRKQNKVARYIKSQKVERKMF